MSKKSNTSFYTKPALTPLFTHAELTAPALTRAAILSASDATLNEWCATKIHGWQLAYPEDYSRKTCYVNTEQKVVQLRYLYTPTDNVAQALAVLERLRSEYGCSIDAHWMNTGEHEVVVWIHQEPNYLQTIRHDDKSLPRAICIAALLAVCAMEEA